MSLAFHSPMWFIIFMTSVKASGVTKFCLAFQKYCKTFDSPLVNTLYSHGASLNVKRDNADHKGRYPEIESQCDILEEAYINHNWCAR